MKDELKNYLKQLSNKNKHNQQNTDIANVGNIFHSKGNFTSY